MIKEQIERLRRRLRVALEKAAGTYYEGPSPPSRLADAVRAFRVMYPEADADAWERFSREEAARGYQEGWQRGFEAHLRGQAEPPPWMRPEIPPPHPLAARVLALGYDPSNPLGRATEAQREELARALLKGWTVEGYGRSGAPEGEDDEEGSEPDGERDG